MVWVIGLLVLLAMIAIVVIAIMRRSDTSVAAPIVETPTRPPRPADPPMNGLESALAQVTGRDGRPIGERIEAEASHVEELRVPDDTGPLLRRALDHVVPLGDDPADQTG